MSADINIYGNFEGGKPQDPDSIKRLGAAEQMGELGVDTLTVLTDLIGK